MAKLKKLLLDQFMGETHAEYSFGEFLTAIFGANGTGKTTIATAYFWLMSDKDYDLQSNPEVHPDFMEESEPSVTAVFDIGGKEVAFRKYQKDMRTKKQKEDNAPLRIANKYEINSVPKTQKDFLADLVKIGIDVDNFLLLTHPDVFCNLKPQDARKILFGMISDVTDIDVAKKIPECSKLVELMENYTTEELTAMNKATVKRCKDQLDAIPNQIIGMERSKVDIDHYLDKKLGTVNKKIAEATEAFEDAKSKANASKYEARILELRTRKTEMYNTANGDRLTKLRDAMRDVDAAESVVNEKKRELYAVQSSGNTLNESYRSASANQKRLEDEYDAVVKDTFYTNETCPTCGQPIPIERIESARQKWQTNHDAKLKDIEDRLRAVKTMKDKYMDEGKALAKKKADAEKAVKDAETIRDQKKLIADGYSEPITPDYAEIDTEITALNFEKSKCAEYQKQAYKLADELKELNNQLQALNNQRVAERNNDRITEMIDEKKAEYKQYGQTKATAERVLYMLQLVSMKKNDILSDAVNSHFNRVKFRLSVTQKNGEIKDDCTPMVLCPDGEYRDMTYSANTASIVAAKLDICRGLQRFYGQELPIWLDGAECFDSDNRKEMATTGQLVMLCVSDDERMVVRND